MEKPRLKRLCAGDSCFQTAESNQVAVVKDQVKGVVPDNLKTPTDGEPCLGSKVGYGFQHTRLIGATQNSVSLFVV